MSQTISTKKSAIRKNQTRNHRSVRRFVSSQSSIDSLDGQPVLGETETLFINICHKVNLFLENQYYRLYPLSHLYQILENDFDQNSLNKGRSFLNSLIEKDEFSFLLEKKEEILTREIGLLTLQRLINEKEKSNLKDFVLSLSSPHIFDQVKNLYLEIVDSWKMHLTLLQSKDKNSSINFVSYLLSFRSDSGFVSISNESYLIYDNRKFNYLANNLDQIFTQSLIKNEILTMLALSILSNLWDKKDPGKITSLGLKIPYEDRNVNKLYSVFCSNRFDTRYGWDKLYSSWSSLYHLILESLNFESPFF